MESIENRVNKCENDIRDLSARVNEEAVNQARIGAQIDSVLLALGKLEKAVEQLRSRPAQRWETLITQIISVLAAALVGAVIGGVM